MKKIRFMTVCIFMFLLAMSVVTVYANNDDTTEYTFEIVRAELYGAPDGGNDIAVSLHSRKPCQSAKLLVWMYDASNRLAGIESKDVDSSDASVIIYTEKDFKNAYVTVWESLSSMKPIAKKVTMGHITYSSYTVEYYKQNVERNGYNLYSAQTFDNVEVGTVITLNESSIPSYDGFSFDSANVSNVLSKTVTPDGIVLKVYYNHIVDEIALEQVRHRLKNKLLSTFNKIKGNLKDTEKPLVKTCINIIEKVLADADAGVLIYIEDYVSTKYRTDIETAKSQLDTLKASGGYTDFKSKLTKHLSIADVEYLAKVMFGIDDIYQYEQDNM